MKKFEFCKMVGKYDLEVLRNNFGIDIEHIDFEQNFKGQKYVKVNMENDLFLFFNDEYFIGALVGNKRLKNNMLEHYSYVFDRYDNKLARNRKNYTSESTVIIRIKREDMRLQRKFNHPTRRENQKAQLNARLLAYKAKKNENVSHDKVLQMGQEIVAYFNKNMFNKELVKDRTLFRLASLGDEYIYDCIKLTLDEIKNLEYYNKELNRSYIFNEEETKKYYNECKQSIIKIYRKINEEA